MFRGNIVRPSHEGGLLISFTGSSPALGSSIETENGVRLGKVDTVLGSIHEPWVHVYPVIKGLDIVDVLGENAIITNKKSFQNSKPRRDDRRSNFSRNGRRNDKKIFNDNDWICPKCKNDNFSWRERCNKCSAPKPKDVGSRTERPRWRRDDNRSERSRRGRDDNRSERPRRGRDDNRSERPKWGRNDNRSERPRRGRDDNRSERPRREGRKFENNKKSDSRSSINRSPKRLRGKSRTHFKNRELDDIFKNRDR